MFFHNKKEMDLSWRLIRFEAYKILAKKGFDVEHSYVIAAKGQEDAKRMLFNACGGYYDYAILGPCVMGEESIFYCSDELPEGCSLFTFVLKKGLKLTLRGIERSFGKKVIGELETCHWAIANR